MTEALRLGMQALDLFFGLDEEEEADNEDKMEVRITDITLTWA